MSSLKAGAMLSLFSGYSLDEAMRVAPQHSSSRAATPDAATPRAPLADLDFSAGNVRTQAVAAARIIEQAQQLLPSVVKRAFLAG